MRNVVPASGDLEIPATAEQELGATKGDATLFSAPTSVLPAASTSVPDIDTLGYLKILLIAFDGKLSYARSPLGRAHAT